MNVELGIIEMNETLAVLKLVSKFGNPKDVRTFIQHVQVKKDFEADTVQFLCSNGHIAIKVTRKGCVFEDYTKLGEQLTIKSIELASKVNSFALLEKGEYEARFPDFDRVFNREDQYEVVPASFDAKYLALIFKSIEEFRRNIKMQIAQVKFEPLSNDKANLMSMMVNQGTNFDEIMIDIAIMPLKV